METNEKHDDIELNVVPTEDLGGQYTVRPSNCFWTQSTNEKHLGRNSSIPRVTDEPQAVWDATYESPGPWNTFSKPVDLDESHY